MFIVKSLTLNRRHSWMQLVKDMGPLEGTMELASDKTKLELKLSPEQTKRIVAVVAEALVDSAKETAAIMTSEIIEQVDGVLALEGGAR